MLKTFFDYCSGIGGGRLGLEQCGLTCVGHSETSRLAEITYTLMHDTANDKNYGNLKNLKGDNLPNYDILIAGFPCQSFSVIGRKDGFNDIRGQIIFHIARLLRETKPKCFILENVKGLVTHDNGKTLRTILKELDDSGYDTVYKVISSLDCGVPQMRQRVYFIGIKKSLNINIQNFDWPNPLPCPNLSSYLIDTDNEIDNISYQYFMKYLVNPTNISRNYSLNNFLKEEYLILDTRMSDMRLYRNKMPTLRAHRDGIYYIKDNKLKSLTGFEALLFQGFPIEYALKVRDKVSNRHLLMQAGNAMTVNVIQLLGKALINLFEKEK